jgi:spore germination protein KA
MLFKKIFKSKIRKIDPWIPPQESRNIKIGKELNANQNRFQEIFGHTSDFYIESLYIGQQEALICYLTTMTDEQAINEKIVLSLSVASVNPLSIDNESELEQFCKEKLAGTQLQLLEYETQVIDNILSGHVILFIKDFTKAISIRMNSISTRSIEEPSTQGIIRGPKDGFTESSDTNLSLIRRRIKNPSLRFERHTIGSDTATTVYICYIDGIVNHGILEEINKRISNIKTNAMFDSGTLEELITDKTITLFPLIYNSERPDSISANLVEGKIAIVVDGSPFVLLLPAVFNDFFQISEDYYHPFLMSSFARMIRYLSFMISLLFPSLYLSVITYHIEIIPTSLLVSLTSQRENIPFPALFEVFIMEITFEILREAGARMPKAVGPTVSIVGGLVIGQAVIEAGIVSTSTVIVIALSTISSFVSPIYSFAVSTRLLRFILIPFASVFGLYGVALGLLILIGHLCGLRSFGIPYMAPFAPFIIEDQKDVIFRFPTFSLKNRPSYLKTEKPLRQPNVEPPTPPMEEDSR